MKLEISDEMGEFSKNFGWVMCEMEQGNDEKLKKLLKEKAKEYEIEEDNDALYNYSNKFF